MRSRSLWREPAPGKPSGKVISQEGRVPFRLIVPGGFPRVNLWLDDAWKDVVKFAFSPGETRYVWLQPELVRYDLDQTEQL